MKNSILNRQFKYTDKNATYFIALVIVAVYVITILFGNVIYYLSMVPIYIYFKHWYWQFLTYIFVHANIWHLFSNMLALLIFGRAIEKNIGTKEFLLFFFFTGILSGIASYLTYFYTGQIYTIILGSSGVIYALMLLFSLLFPNAIVFVFGLIPIRAPLLVIIYFFIEFFSQFSQDGVAHLVHLYGLLFALLYSTIRMRMNPLKRWGLI